MSDKPTHIVKHPKLHLAVGGKLQHVPPGTPVTLSEKAAASLLASGKVIHAKEGETLKIGKSDAEEKAIAEAEAQLAASSKKK